jgi:hypothetical protein
VKYALQYTFDCGKLENFLGSASPSPDLTLFGSYGALIFAPPALILGALGLHSRTLTHGEVEVGGALSQFVPLKLGGELDAPATTNRIIVFYASRAY